jgi:hypothetical protein
VGHLLLAVLTAILLSGTAQAETVFHRISGASQQSDQCFVGSYDVAHLKRHPRQRVTHFRLRRERSGPVGTNNSAGSRSRSGSGRELGPTFLKYTAYAQRGAQSPSAVEKAMPVTFGFSSYAKVYELKLTDLSLSAVAQTWREATIVSSCSPRGVLKSAEAEVRISCRDNADRLVTAATPTTSATCRACRHDVIHAIEIEGQSIRQTAEELKMTEGAVSVALHRGVAMLAAIVNRVAP